MTRMPQNFKTLKKDEQMYVHTFVMINIAFSYDRCGKHTSFIQPKRDGKGMNFRIAKSMLRVHFGFPFSSIVPHILHKWPPRATNKARMSH